MYIRLTRAFFIPKHRQRPNYPNARGINRNNDHGLLLVAGCSRICFAHEDDDFTVWTEDTCEGVACKYREYRENETEKWKMKISIYYVALKKLQLCKVKLTYWTKKLNQSIITERWFFPYHALDRHTQISYCKSMNQKNSYIWYTCIGYFHF